MAYDETFPAPGTLVELADRRLSERTVVEIMSGRELAPGSSHQSHYKTPVASAIPLTRHRHGIGFARVGEFAASWNESEPENCPTTRTSVSAYVAASRPDDTMASWSQANSRSNRT